MLRKKHHLPLFLVIHYYFIPQLQFHVPVFMKSAIQTNFASENANVIGDCLLRDVKFVKYEVEGKVLFLHLFTHIT